MRGALLGLVITAAALSSGAAPAAEEGHQFFIQGGRVLGPGPMPETPMPEGRFTHIVVDHMLTGKSAFFNNGPEPPNVPPELEIFGKHTGLLSDGTRFNEHLHGGVVVIGQGALRMMAVLAERGPNKGEEHYRLDEMLNLRILADLALDPGFKEGLIVSENVDIKTGVIWVAPSHQTEQGIEGGFDLAGHIPTGAPLVGRLGDADEDGMLDGEIIGVGRAPLDYMFVPGSPLIQTRQFKSDIPVPPRASGILAVANLYNLKLMLTVYDRGNDAAKSYMDGEIAGVAAEFAARAERAAARLARANAAEAALAADVQAALVDALPLAGSPTEYRAAVEPALSEIADAMPALRQAFAAEMLAR